MPVSYRDVPTGLRVDGKRELVKRPHGALCQACQIPGPFTDGGVVAA